MSDSDIAARLIEALNVRVGEDPNVRAELVTVSIEKISAGEIKRVEARIERRTRTLCFAAADALDDNGELIATAQSVHKLSAI